VTIDKTTTQSDGFSAADNFTALFDSGSLTQGQHTVVITNQQIDAKKQYLDVDYVCRCAYNSLILIHDSHISDHLVDRLPFRLNEKCSVG
jgi:hypothetical protein